MNVPVKLLTRIFKFEKWENYQKKSFFLKNFNHFLFSKSRINVKEHCLKSANFQVDFLKKMDEFCYLVVQKWPLSRYFLGKYLFICLF